MINKKELTMQDYKDLERECRKYKADFLRAIETVNAMQGEIDELQAKYDNIKDHMIEAAR